MLRWLLLLLLLLTGTRRLLVIASDCPLDFSWSNFTSVASVCSDITQRGKCCRYINALIAVSVAHYATGTGQLGVPPVFSDMCISSVSETLKLNGVPPNATIFCGLGTKILVNYQCRGRSTILDMLQSPNFTSVVTNCKMPLVMETSCRRCKNSGILYLRHLIGAEDNVTLSTCRDAAFVALANQGDLVSAADLASCFFTVQGLSILPANISGAPPPLLTPGASPSPLLTGPPTQLQIGLSSKEHRHPYQLTLIQGVGIGITGAAVLLLIILVLLIQKKNRQLNDTSSHMETSSNVLPSQARKCLKEGSVTRKQRKVPGNFSSVLGRGGYGTVYKAQFSDGFVAAVKRMNKVSHQGEDDFCREMELLGRLHHRHIVALKGFCVEKHERFLMYEYMENGSLKDHLHSPGRTPLSWQTRMRIAIDVANALEYLHFYCDPPLCHRDIKSSNILLDENFVAKVADFGLAYASSSGSISFEPLNTDVRGTPGYMDPEYVVTQELTEKSDVYSYGVLLLELVSGRHAVQDNKNLVEWSLKFLDSVSMLPELVDPRISDSFDVEQLQVIVGIIQWCTQGEGRARPSIKQVLRMLYEGLDPVQRDFVEAIGDGEDYEDGGSRTDKDKLHRSVIISYSGDARCLMSSSSTSKSYCSRSLLLESGSPQSPRGNFSG